MRTSTLRLWLVMALVMALTSGAAAQTDIDRTPVGGNATDVEKAGRRRPRTRQPSNSPTPYPTRAPVTSRPTKSPV
eukprot:CAMPEP_0202107706 /NCGR_PEP_ID=MMETSP0965-20130614/17643_1 /ASSEMBLY_ACC=CAM_ASM_000507 /TAXON_ID=4773 /ORGANISM="Schizochytrium aggregatum, Strain ATCC28209" /LENGTH=75 /DNA_ID=CAMNT_0048676887 /DNA_START=103 /DNA_END=326 /DNA_ORIENTATION=-